MSEPWTESLDFASTLLDVPQSTQTPHSPVQDPVCPGWRALQLVVVSLLDKLVGGQEVDGLLIKALWDSGTVCVCVQHLSCGEIQWNGMSTKEHWSQRNLHSHARQVRGSTHKIHTP